MKIILAGNNLRGIECLKYLHKKKIGIPLVIGHPEKKNSPYFTTLKKISRKLKLNYIAPKNINFYLIEKKIKKINPDLMVLVGYSNNILKKKIYSIPKYGTINLHASDLPQYKGGSPLNWAIVNNEKKIGISIIQVDEGIDTGHILAQRKNIKIKKSDDIKLLTSKVTRLYLPLLLKTIKNFQKNKIVKKKQNKKLGSYFPKRSEKDGKINFNLLNALQVNCLVRALVPPYPGAYFFYKKKKIIVLSTKIIKKKVSHKSSQILKVKKNNVHISTKKDIINIKSYIIKNKNTKKIFKVGDYVD